MDSNREEDLPELQPPHATALPADAPAVDHTSLSHTPFPAGFRARRGLNWMALGLLYTSYYMCRYNLPLANKAMSDQYGFSKEQMGLIISATTLATLWLLIFLFHATTPVDLQEREILAHADRSHPVHLITMADEIRLVELAEQTPAQPRPIQ